MIDPFIPVSAFAERYTFCLWYVHLRVGRPVEDQEIAAETGIPVSSITTMRTLKNGPREMQRVEPLAQFFGVDPTWLAWAGGREPELWSVWHDAREAVASSKKSGLKALEATARAMEAGEPPPRDPEDEAKHRTNGHRHRGQ